MADDSSDLLCCLLLIAAARCHARMQSNGTPRTQLLLRA